MLFHKTLLLRLCPRIFLLRRLLNRLRDVFLLLITLRLGLVQRLLGQDDQFVKIHSIILFQLSHQFILPRPQNDFIINIRRINLIQDIVMEVIRHDTSHDIKGQICPCMPHVTGVIDRRAAGVPAHMTCLHGHEGFLLAGESVAEEELAAGDGVGVGDFGGIPWVPVGGVLADWLAEVACAGEGHCCCLLLAVGAGARLQ
mmetsp:Transcript_17567/g.28752  ORF Transcript_17567/g.28752 Transcript_17567/m.28752 type:complete len:200 (-) Transcript_17567:28-627(-)